MIVPCGLFQLDVRSLRLVDLIEIAAASLRGSGDEANAIALFRLRIKIREGLSYEEAKIAFDQHTKSLFKEKN